MTWIQVDTTTGRNINLNRNCIESYKTYPDSHAEITMTSGKVWEITLSSFIRFGLPPTIK